MAPKYDQRIRRAPSSAQLGWLGGMGATFL